MAIARRSAKAKAERAVGVVFLVVGGISAVIVLLSVFFDVGRFATKTFWFDSNWTAALVFFILIMVCLIFSHIAQGRRIKHVIPVRHLGDALPQIGPFQAEGDRVDIAELLDKPALGVVDQAFKLARQFGHGQVDPLHVFIASLSDDNASAVLGRLQISFEKVKDPLARRLTTRQLAPETVLSEAAEHVLLSAFINAYQQGRQVVNAFEIFYEAFGHDDFVQELFYDLGVTAGQMANMVEWVRIHEKTREQYEAFRRAAQFKPVGAMNRSMTAVATPTLDAFSVDLTTVAVQGRTGILVGREKELEEVFRIIEGGRQSAVLVGQDGVGKEAILEGIAVLMVEERVPQVLQDKRLVRVSLPHLVSGATTEQAQERLMLALMEASRSGNIILAFSDLDEIPVELSAVLVEFLSRGNTFAVATTTPRGYTATIERSILGRVFEKVLVAEPDIDESIRVLESKVLAIEYDQHVSFTYLAVESIVQLTDRFMHETYLPQKAIEVAKEVAVMVAKERGQNAVITSDDASRLIAQKTGIPITRVAEQEKDTLLHLEERLHGRVVGQEEAVEAIASALRRARTQLRSEDRPMATFLFLGPTGVGKTELAKTVAEAYFGSEDNMIRLDMSEYQTQDSVVRLIGRPGQDEGGLFTEAVRQQPFALILLDEFEKADPGILNLFLQVFDDGRLTDAAGRTIDFTNTILVATSNAGTSYIQEAVKQQTSLEDIKTHLLEEELKGIYRPELLNRFDGVIVFKPLTQEQTVEIAKRMIAQVAERLEAKGMHFRASDEVIAALAHKGYDPKFGARPLRRLVQEEVDNTIAKALLEQEVRRRDTIVLEASGIRIEKAEAL